MGKYIIKMLKTQKANKAFVYGIKAGFFFGTTNEYDHGYHLYATKKGKIEAGDHYIGDGNNVLVWSESQEDSYPNQIYDKLLATTDSELPIETITQDVVNDFMATEGSSKRMELDIGREDRMWDEVYSEIKDSFDDKLLIKEVLKKMKKSGYKPPEKLNLKK